MKIREVDSSPKWLQEQTAQSAMDLFQFMNINMRTRASAMNAESDLKNCCMGKVRVNDDYCGEKACSDL